MSDFETRRQERSRQQQSQSRTLGDDLHTRMHATLLGDSRNSGPTGPLGHGGTGIDDTIQADQSDLHLGRQEFSFAEDEIWADMFASAGFNIQEGVFFA